mmetsp:Transcript_13452/g.53443  ORF Transcript_13452/g.53443 Transcript_13452/m.53443 type:complete len:515 (+) Transcript_13452:43-1587(+)
MPRRKKKFVDKKLADTYRVVHRSLRDPTFGTEGRSDYVLAPVPAPNMRGKTREEVRAAAGQDGDDVDAVYRMLRAQHLVEGPPAPPLSDGDDGDDSDDDSDLDLPPELEEMDGAAPAVPELEVFPDDGYDYAQHLKPIGGGTFVPAVPLPDDVFGVPALEEDAALFHPQAGGAERYLDDDILAALEGEASDVEELEDDFLYIADKEPVRAAAAEEEEVRPYDRLDIIESDDYARLGFEEEPKHFKYQKGEEPDHNKRRIVRVRDFSEIDNPSVLDAQFERMVHEFSDDEIGELDDEDPRLQGNWDLGNLESVLDEFIDSTKPLVDPDTLVAPEEIVRRKNEGKAPAPERGDDGDYEDEEEEEEALPLTWVPVKVEPEWDCESILSTYSSAYNHPKLVDVGPKPRIELSKRGMPLAALSNGKAKAALAALDSDDEEESEEEGDEASTMSVNHGAKRKRKETAEEKRARKAAVKAMRRDRRMQKKELKTRFKEEAVRQGGHMVQNNAANPAGMRLH